MVRKIVSGLALITLLVGMLALTLESQLTKTEEPPIEIWEDYTLDRDITFAGHGFIVKADGVTLDLNGHTVTGSDEGLEPTCGVDLSEVNMVTVKNGRILNFSRGICVTFSHNNTITGNTLTNNTRSGMLVSFSDNNTITENTLTTNKEWGMRLGFSGNNFLRDNSMVGNLYNLEVYSYYLSSLINDIDTSNTVNGKPVYYWVNEQDRQVPSDAGYVGIVNSTNIIVTDLTLTDNSGGVIFAFTDNSTIENVNATNNVYGIYLYRSNYNTVIGNMLTNNIDGIYLWVGNRNTIAENMLTNNDHGLHLWYEAYNNTIAENMFRNNKRGVELGEICSNNSIYHNNFVNNTVQASTSHTCALPNVWGCDYPSGGNYWSDYNGSDNFWGINQDLKGCDMMGDTPYFLDENNTDKYPLIMPWVPSKPAITEFPDLNGDGKISIKDLFLVARHFGEEFQEQ